MTLMADIAYIYCVSGRAEEAKDMFDKIEALGGFGENDKPVQYATLLAMQADVYCRLGRPVEAEVYQRKALSVRERVYSSDHHAVIATRENLATTLTGQQNYAEAEDLLRGAVTAYDCHAQSATEPPDVARAGHKTAWAKKNLAAVLFLQGKVVESLGLFNEALEISLAVGVVGPRVEELRNSIACVHDVMSKAAAIEEASQGEV